jgi:hypothetical protein
MRTLARTLLVVLGLLASLREAGAAACASTCVGRPWDEPATSVAAGASCSLPADDSPAPCCSPCDEPALPCPLLEPAPEALIERAPAARALPEAVTFGALGLPLDLPSLLAAHDARGAGEPPACGLRARAGPLWLRDLRLLI